MVHPLLAPRRLRREPVPRVEFARTVEIEVHVDAALLELGDEEIETLEPLRVELEPRVAADCRERAPAAALHEVPVGWRVEDVQTHEVEPEPREPIRGPHGVRVHRAGGRADDVHAVEADFPGVGHEALPLDPHEPVLPGRRVQECGHVHGVRRRIVRHHERKQSGIIGSRPRGRNNPRRQHQGQQQGFPRHAEHHLPHSSRTNSARADCQVGVR